MHETEGNLFKTLNSLGQSDIVKLIITQSAVDSLIRQGVKPENIRFTQAVRPREVWGKDTIPLKAIKETCDNCQATWPTGAHK